MSDPRIAAFLALAEEERAAAALLVDAAPRQAAYFLAQAVEKVARAALAGAGVAWGTGHQIGQMAAALPPEHALRAALLGLDRLSAASTRYRYPAPGGRLAPAPQPGELRHDLDRIAALIVEARTPAARAR